MSRFSGHIERRIFNAVLLVLSACERPIQTQPPQPGTETAATPDAASAVAVAPLVDAAVAGTPVDARVDAGALATAPVGDAEALCADHKKRSRIDRRKARQGTPPMAGARIYDPAVWDAANGVAVCTIVHDRVPGNVVVMYASHWCPHPGGGPRPDPVPRKVKGEKLLVERASIRADGTVVHRDLEWTASGTVNEVRHRCGRRFEGLELDDPVCDDSDSDDPGAQLAAMAELEAASVPAFDRLARELATWGAPAELVQRAWLAMHDEIRHARVMTALARRYGRVPRMIPVPWLPCRSLAAIAHENAIEGCVREAYGALVATYQAERASPELGAVFHSIAVDERRHAELAEDVHAWIVGQLDASSRETIERDRSRAEAELRASVTASRACRELGLPSGLEAVALCDAYFA